MKKFEGNLRIEIGDTRDFSQLEEVTGYLYVSNNVTLPMLASVGGDLYVSNNVTFDAPILASVGGYLSVSNNVTLPMLASVGGYLYVSNNVTLPMLASVGGYLSVSNNVTLPMLASVGGYLSVYSNVTLPMLASVGGDLYVYSNVTFDAPILASVGGDLYVYSNVTLNIKFLNKINYIVADNKAFLIESKKTSKGITIYSGFNIKGVKNCKVKKRDTIYLASKDEFFAHGETVKKAVEDLQFKVVSEKLKNEPIKEDTVLTIQYYRLLTGACEFGVKEWMSSNKINEGITAKELLPILEKTNAYGLSKFKQLITF